MNKTPMIIAIILFCMPIFSQADVLIIDRIKTNSSINMPSRGLNMTQVISQFGEPTIKNAAIGEPPITVWNYPNFSVYFEGSYVINSVVLKASKQEKGPKQINQD